MDSLQDYRLYISPGDTFGNELSLWQWYGLHLPSLHKTAPSALASQDWQQLPNHQANSLGCSTETVEANTNNGMAEFQPVQTDGNISTEKYINHEIVCKWFWNMYYVWLHRYLREKRAVVRPRMYSAIIVFHKFVQYLLSALCFDWNPLPPFMPFRT